MSDTEINFRDESDELVETIKQETKKKYNLTEKARQSRLANLAKGRAKLLEKRKKKQEKKKSKIEIVDSDSSDSSDDEEYIIKKSKKNIKKGNVSEVEALKLEMMALKKHLMKSKMAKHKTVIQMAPQPQQPQQGGEVNKEQQNIKKKIFNMY